MNDFRHVYHLLGAEVDHLLAMPVGGAGLIGVGSALVGVGLGSAPFALIEPRVTATCAMLVVGGLLSIAGGISSFVSVRRRIANIKAEHVFIEPEDGDWSLLTQSERPQQHGVAKDRG